MKDLNDVTAGFGVFFATGSSQLFFYFIILYVFFYNLKTGYLKKRQKNIHDS